MSQKKKNDSGKIPPYKPGRVIRKNGKIRKIVKKQKK